ncbi:MAG: bifunctional folylpolyglutamate synthase/dihydrofolate synthase [Eubacterium sp.]
MAYIKETGKYGSVLGLTNITELEKRLGNPQDKIKTVHVAGTNGKGSTIAFISTIMQIAGYKVGRYISPTVDGYRERIQINGRNISRDELAETATKVRKCADAMVEEGFTHPTAFEIETAMAFVYFNDNQCDIAVIETGMGGMLDATNTIKKPVCSVITSVSMDHMQFLGESLLEIAAAKSGIIKEGAPVVVSNQSASVMEVMTARASECGSSIYITNPVIFEEDNRKFSYLSRQGVTFKNLKTGLIGGFQAENAANAIETALLLRNSGFDISDADIKKGLKTAKWKCRMERILKQPEFFVDGAHNPAAAKALMSTLEMYFTNRKIIFIMGVLADKDYEQIVKLTAPAAQYIYTVTPNNNRALSAMDLCAVVKKYNKNVSAMEDIKMAATAAIDKAKELAAVTYASGMVCINQINDEPLIVAFGSLSYLQKLKKTVKAVRRD